MPAAGPDSAGISPAETVLTSTPNPAGSARPVERDAQRVDRRGQHLVMADQHQKLEGGGLVEVATEIEPGVVAKIAPVVQLIDGGEQDVLAVAPTGGGGPLDHAVDLGRRHPSPLGQEPVMGLFVLATGQVGHPQDDQLGLPPWQLAAGHQPSGEPQPAPKQLAVATQREKQVGRGGAGDQARRLGEGPVEHADIGAFTRRSLG